jgi:hypothetical protein
MQLKISTVIDEITVRESFTMVCYEPKSAHC